jgi:hypothetical protein
MKIEIDGIGQVEVGDEFGSMSPDQQRAVVGHITDQASKGVMSGLGGNTIGATERTAFQRGDYTTGPKQDLPQQPWSGSVLPVSSDTEGNLKFDPNAGVIGGLLKTFKTPGDVYQGKVDLNTPEGFGQALQMGVALNPMGPVGAIAPRAVVAPGREILKDAAGSTYDAVRDMKVPYNSGPVAERVGALKSQLEQTFGIDRDTSPKSFNALDVLDRRLSEKPQITTEDIEIARRKLDAAASDFNNKTDQKTAGLLRKGLEGFIENPPPKAVPNEKFDDAMRAAGLMKEARGNYAAASRAETLDKLAEKADRQAAVANSGLNLDNTLRQRVNSLLNDPKKIRGFSDEEKAALNEVAMGTPSRNAIRYASNLLGGGGGLGAVTAGLASGILGAATGGPMGAALGGVPPVVGLLAKKYSAGATRNALEAANEMVRQRSPMYEGILSQQPPSIPLPDYYRLGMTLLSQSPWRQR